MKRILIKASILISIIVLNSCITINCTGTCLTINCTQIGYGQKIDGTFFDDNTNTGYFIYSFLENKDNKRYLLYKIDINGKYEKISDLGVKNLNEYQLYLTYEFKIIDNNKIFIKENENYYLTNQENKKLIYKKNLPLRSLLNNSFSTDNKYFLLEENYLDEKNTNIFKYSLFDIEKGSIKSIDLLYKSINYNKNIDIFWLKNSEYLMIVSYIDYNNYFQQKIYRPSKISIFRNTSEKIWEYTFEKEGYNRIFSPILIENGILNFNVLDPDKKTNELYNLDFDKNKLSLIEEKTYE
ncbi:MAG: hypothetical protein U0457_00925 [Candidatus Sericytochromatia bacterium]